VKYGELFGFMGFYIVKPAYHGQGYGMQIWNACLNYFLVVKYAEFRVKISFFALSIFRIKNRIPSAVHLNGKACVATCFKLILATSLVLIASGCTNLAYYAQAVQGHMKLMGSARPIHELVGDAATEAGLRRQLEQVIAIREFASRELTLPDNASYRSYADLGRPFVVWNVFVAPELSQEPQQWCFTFAGCVNYRGYFDKNDAEAYAAKLTGSDTYIGGVTAYSTLGHFNDPVLNTFLRFGEQEVARIIFHELAHQVVYAEGDSAFNESFASTVENEGLHRWIMQSGTPQRQRDFEQRQERKAQFHQLVSHTRDKLRLLYDLDYWRRKITTCPPFTSGLPNWLNYRKPSV
jgi:predicted aminopeptidase